MEQSSTPFEYTGREVHTFQINVPVGDCAIHLLVKKTWRYPKETYVEPSTQNPNEVFDWDLPKHRRLIVHGKKRGTITRAILVDGGQDDTPNNRGNLAAERIKKVIEAIELDYDFEYENNNFSGTQGRDKNNASDIGSKQLMFDAWIVTHWDRDHWAGALQMIHDDIKERYQPAIEPDASKDSLVAQDTGNLSTYFKYDDNGNCFSTLYAATWKRPKWENTPKGRKDAKEAWEHEHAKGAPLIFAQKVVKLGPVGQQFGCVRINVWGSVGKKAPLDFASIDPDTGNTKCLSGLLFRLVHGQEDLIGRDLFTGHQLFDVPHRIPDGFRNKSQDFNLASFIKHAAENHASKPNERDPLFLCIGAEGSIMGYDGSSEKTMVKGCTRDNRASIITAITWFTKELDPNGYKIRLSHLCGGDAHRNTEIRLLNFLTGPDKKPLAVEVLKASHHGSKDSTPAALLIACNPKKFIISAGRKYGHPHWLTIVLLATYFRRQREQATPGDRPRWRERPLINTRFPYYMHRGGTNIKDITRNAPGIALHPKEMKELETVVTENERARKMTMNLNSYYEDHGFEDIKNSFPDAFKQEKGKAKALRSLEEYARNGNITLPQKELYQKWVEKDMMNRGYKSEEYMKKHFVECTPKEGLIYAKEWQDDFKKEFARLGKPSQNTQGGMDIIPDDPNFDHLDLKNPDAVAWFLYRNCTAPMAVSVLFQRIERDSDKSPAKDIESPEADIYRAVLARLMRFFWDELSAVGVFQTEFKHSKIKIEAKLDYVLLAATKEEAYDGRVYTAGKQSSIPGVKLKAMLCTPASRSSDMKIELPVTSPQSDLKSGLTPVEKWYEKWQTNVERRKIEDNCAYKLHDGSECVVLEDDDDSDADMLPVTDYSDDYEGMKFELLVDDLPEEHAGKTLADLFKSKPPSSKVKKSSPSSGVETLDQFDEVLKKRKTEGMQFQTNCVGHRPATRDLHRDLQLFLAMDSIGINVADILFGLNHEVYMVQTTSSSETSKNKDTPSSVNLQTSESSVKKRESTYGPYNTKGKKGSSPPPSPLPNVKGSQAGRGKASVPSAGTRRPSPPATEKPTAAVPQPGRTRAPPQSDLSIGQPSPGRTAPVIRPPASAVGGRPPELATPARPVAGPVPKPISPGTETATTDKSSSTVTAGLPAGQETPSGRIEKPGTQPLTQPATPKGPRERPSSAIGGDAERATAGDATGSGKPSQQDEPKTPGNPSGKPTAPETLPGKGEFSATQQGAGAKKPDGMPNTPRSGPAPSPEQQKQEPPDPRSSSSPTTVTTSPVPVDRPAVKPAAPAAKPLQPVPWYRIAASHADASRPVSLQAMLAADLANSAGLSAKHDHLLAEPGSAGQLFLGNTGSALLVVEDEHKLSSIRDGDNGGGANVLSYSAISEYDVTREYISSAWTMPDAVSALRGMYVRVEELPFVGNSNNVPGFVRIADVCIEVARDDTSAPLLFSAGKEALNLQFEEGNQQLSAKSPPGSAVAGTAVTTPVVGRTDKSGIERFPGHLILGLVDVGGRDGGFKTLGDLLPLVNIRPAKWLAVLLKATELKLGGSSEGGRTPGHNAIWYQPGNRQTLVIRLGGRVSLHSEIGKKMSKYLDTDWVSKIPHLEVVAKRTAALNYEEYDDGLGSGATSAVDLETELVLGVELDIGAPRSLGIYVAILEDYITLMLVCYSRELTWSALKTWLLKNCQGISSAVGQLQDNLEKISGAPGATPKKSEPSTMTPDAGSKPGSLSGIYWRKVSASISESGIQAVYIELEASVPFLVARGKHAGFSMSFSWRPGQCEFDCEFMGDGVARPELPGAGAGDAALTVPPQYKADYERWTHLEPLVLSEPFMSLRYLKSRDSPLTNKEIPYGVPTEISQVALAVSNTGLSFSGKLQSLLGAEEAAAEEGSGGGVPVLKLAYVDLDFALAVDYSSKPTNITGRLEGVVALEPRPDPVTGRVRLPAELRAKIEYGTVAPGSWNFEASVARIPLTSLYSLFAQGSEQDAVMAMLSSITLERMMIGYTYSGAAASSVRFSANATVGGLVVDTRFLRTSPGQWLFGAQLAPRIADNSSSGSGSIEVVGVPAGMKKVTLFEATRDLLGADVAELLPDFIQGTELLISTASGGRDKLSIECRRVEGKPNDNIVFGATLSFGTLRVHFGQITTLVSKADDEAAVKKATEAPLATSGQAVSDKPPPSRVKRLIRVTLGPLPTMQSLPLVGNLELPCDTLEFLWLGADLSSAELSTISSVLDSGVEASPVNIAVASGEESLALGYYFRLLGKDNSVVVSYPFGHTPKPKAKGATSDGKVDIGGQKVAAEPTKPPAQAPSPAPEAKTAGRKSTEVATMAPIKKQKGSVKLSGVGLTFEGGVLRIHLDARVLVGPIGAGVNGLQINLNLNKVKGLHSLLGVGLSVDIQGFEMSFDRSPVLLSGALELEKTESAKRFSGGIAISVKSITINALGMYEQVYAQPPLPAYDSFFVYGMVEGTLFTVGWAEVRGIIAGFGYNSRLRLPPVDQLMSFPLVSGFDDGGGVSILSALSRLTGKGGPDAWISPSMGSLWFAAGLVIRACQTLDIRAVATLALGPNQKEIGLLARATACLPRGSTPDKALMLIDLSILGKLDLVRGELAVDGLINPTSFILSKDCRPSGGFAIRTWFHGEQKNPYAGDWVVTFGGYHPSFRAPAHYPNPGRLRINWAISSCLRVTGEAYAAITPGAVMAGARLSAVFSKGALQAYFDANADFLVNMAPLHYEATVAVRAGVSYEIRIWKLRKKLSIEIGARLELEGPPLGGRVSFEASVVSFTVDFGAGGKRGTPAALKLDEFVDLVLKESSDDGAKVKNPHTLAVVSGRIADGRSAQNKKTKAQEPWLVRADAFVFSMRSPVPLSTYKVLESETGSASIAGSSGAQILSRPMKVKPGDGQKSLQSNLTVAAYPVTPGLPPVTLTRVTETWDHVPSNLWGAFSDNRDDYLRPDKIPPTVNHLVGLTLRAPQPKLPKDSLTITKTSERVWPSDTSRVKAATAAALAPSAAQNSKSRSTRYTIDSNARESVQWSRVQGAMVPSVGSSVAVAGAKGLISREEVLDEFVKLLYPEKSDAVAGSTAGSATSTTIPSEARVRRAYRRIGARAPRVVVDQPQRYYRAAPVVFVS